MKRVKESYYRQHPNWNDTAGISGIKELEGEDLAYEARVKFNKEQQRKWIEEQIAEKKRKADLERQEEEAYALQAREMNRMRGLLEDEFRSKKNDIKESMKSENQQLAKQKSDKEAQEKKERLDFEKDDISTITQRGQKRPFNG